eukprot:CAMPEP_0178414406 /NCGR_PEP_ID=MMETSP0689_2-20121128/23019_1 /TAXON_ID=160604 /ORGANISM="Amphidinium massartii, Strain CS-259" /LENGTH=939 /DNA_ID=CAMNT_0020035693 /DNA_START=14 /DNA_END=2829 /DNA_ORIENTATION=+
MAFTPGALVEISGLPGKAQPSTAAAGKITETDINGEKAQLVEYDWQIKKWVAATFSGIMLTIDEKFLRLLSAEDVASYDFVLGPEANWEILGESIAETLSSKGYAVLKAFMAADDAANAIATVKRLEEEENFTRMAVEFEPGYLGRDGVAKTMFVDNGLPAWANGSALSILDDNVSMLMDVLRPHAAGTLGFDLYSRTQLLLQLPLVAGDDEKYTPAEIDDADAEQYMHLMIRRRVTALQFAGPGSGTIRLTSKAGGPDVELAAEPHTVLLFLSRRWDYTYEAAEGSSAMSSFFLVHPPVYTLDRVESGTTALATLGNGPPAPSVNKPDHQISVCAFHCKEGGGSDSKEAYWNAITASADGLTAVPLSRWDMDAYYDPDSLYGGSYTKHGCFGIEGVEFFDNKFFEISPAEAKVMDPLQRQVLEVSYTALLEGGWSKRDLQKKSENICHFVGVDKDDWASDVAKTIDMGGSFGATGATNAIIANRFSYLLNIKGSSMQIDTACSSSLVCTHVAKLHLKFQDADAIPACIINGVNLCLSPGPFIGCSGANMLSHEGRCFTFNATADGYARGELCSAMCVKRKAFDPETDFGCVAGTQANQDGKSASMTAPNGPAQEKCINAVLRETGLKPSEVDCIECHGTGTALGDPIEVGAFKKVMSGVPRDDPLVITSSKSNIGHGEGGAGLAGFLKCVEQVAHCEACSNLHLKVLNPHLDFSGFPCQVLSEKVVMREDSAYTGVSSFGFGGTNAHAEAWGRNVMTSRGAVNTDHSSAFIKKLINAPVAEITMNGDDALDWETTGLHPNIQPGEKFKVELDEEGIATWEIEEEDDENFGDEFAIQGTFNSWGQDDLEPHDSIPGLWVGDIVIGNKGEEEFQVIADGEKDMVYYPGMPRCTLKSAPVLGPAEPGQELKVLGPAEPGQELTWLIRGTPGDRFRVEFFQS